MFIDRATKAAKEETGRAVVILTIAVVILTIAVFSPDHPVLAAR